MKTLTLSLALLALGMLAAPAGAVPVLWTLTDVQFDDGATAIGSFVYDADLDQFSAVSIETTPGFVPGAVYGEVLFGAATDALAIPAGLADLTGAPALQLVFQQPLTNAGGVADLASFVPGFSSFEQTCFDASCFSAGVDRTVLTGGVIGTVVPLPAAGWLFVSALALVWSARRPAARPRVPGCA